MAFPKDFTDAEILLALCIREEALDNPEAWCQELRDLHQAQKVEPKTSDEAHALMARSDQLFGAIKRNPDARQLHNHDNDNDGNIFSAIGDKLKTRLGTDSSSH